MTKIVPVVRPLIALVAAFGLMGAAQPVAMSEQDQADANCLAAVSILTGQASENEPEKTQGLTSILTYYVGKLKGRNPDFHMAEVMTPAFVQTVMANLSEHMERCSKEALEVVEDLDDTAKALSAAGG